MPSRAWAAPLAAPLSGLQRGGTLTEPYAKSQEQKIFALRSSLSSSPLFIATRLAETQGHAPVIDYFATCRHKDTRP